jgi:DNA polymerase-3 subunit epsilon
LLIDAGASETIAGIATRVDLRQFTLPVLLASDQESAAHEAVLQQLDQASGGRTVWKIATGPMA